MSNSATSQADNRTIGFPAGSVVEKPRFLDGVRSIVRARHYSLRTEKAYVGWIRRFIVFYGKRHPGDMGEGEVAAFVSALAARRHVSASTQNQALSALLFLYRDVLGRPLAPLPGLVHAKRPVRLPVVLSRGEVAALLGRLEGVPHLMRR